MASDCKIAVLISGRGSNLQSLLENAQHYEITHVFSNNAGSQGLVKASSRGLKTQALDRSAFQSVKEQKRAIFEAVAESRPDIVVLAGFMQILEPYFIENFAGRIINIHPSLLPKYPGLDTHKRVLEAGESEHGCSVHFVDTGVDTGPIIAQAMVAVLPSDTEQDLSERVLEEEHRLYPAVLNGLGAGEIRIASGSVVISAQYREKLLSDGFLIPA